MTPSEAYAELGLTAAEASRRSVRSAYARRLKQVRPEEDPAGFMRLRAAYDLARRIAPETPRGEEAAAEAADDWGERDEADAGGAAPHCGPQDAVPFDAPDHVDVSNPFDAPDPFDDPDPFGPPPATAPDVAPPPAPSHPAGLDAPWVEPEGDGEDGGSAAAHRRLNRDARDLLRGEPPVEVHLRAAESRPFGLRRSVGRWLLLEMIEEDEWDAFASPWSGGAQQAPRALTLAQAEALNRMFRFDQCAPRTFDDVTGIAYWRIAAAALEDAHGPEALPPDPDLRGFNARCRAEAEARGIDYYDHFERKVIVFAPASRAMQAIREMDDDARADPAEWVKILDAPYIQTLDEVERLTPPLRGWIAEQTGFRHGADIPSPIPVPAWLTPEVLTVIDRRHAIGRALGPRDHSATSRHLAALCAALLDPEAAPVAWQPAASTRARWKPPFYATWSGLLLAYFAFRFYQLI